MRTCVLSITWPKEMAEDIGGRCWLRVYLVPPSTASSSQVSYARIRSVAGLRILIGPSIGPRICRSVRLIALKTGASVR